MQFVWDMLTPRIGHHYYRNYTSLQQTQQKIAPFPALISGWQSVAYVGTTCCLDVNYSYPDLCNDLKITDECFSGPIATETEMWDNVQNTWISMSYGVGPFTGNHDDIFYFRNDLGCYPRKICTFRNLTFEDWLTSAKKRVTAMVHYSYSLNNLVLYDENSNVMLVHVSGDTEIVEPCVASCEILLPWNWTTSQVHVTVYVGNEVVLKASFNYVRNIVCQVANCFFCLENFQSFNCMTAAMKGFLIFAIVVGSIFGIILVGLLMNCTCVGMKAMGVCQPTPMQLLIVFMIATAMACDTNLLIGKEHMICTETLTHYNCYINTNALLILTHLHAQACLTLVTQDEGMLIGTINITLDSTVALTPTALMYYTSHFKAIHMSRKACANSQYCDSVTDCSKTNFTDPTADGALYGSVTRYPGISLCSDTCGCWGCQCFNCAEACTLSRYALSPIPSLYQVRRILPGVIQPTITVSSDLNGVLNTTELTITSSGGDLVGFDNLTLTYYGTGTKEIFTGDDRLIMSQGQQWFAKASQVNAPIAGMVGDIQGNSQASFTNPTPTSFIFASDICTGYMSDSSMQFLCRPSGVTAQSGWRKLPTADSNAIWTMNEGYTLNADLLDPGSTMLGLDFETNAIISVKKTQVCPQIEFIGVNGFWGTDVPAAILLRGKSTCLPGPCILSVNSNEVVLAQYSTYLSLELEHLSISFYASKKEVKFELTCKSLRQAVTILVEGELQDPEPVQPVEPPVPSEGFNHWFDDLSLGGKIGLFIGIFFFTVAAIGILLVANYLFGKYGEPAIRNKYNQINTDEEIEELPSEDRVNLEDAYREEEEMRAKITALRNKIMNTS